MPEVGEVAHAVANLRRNILGFTIKKANFLFDDIVFTGLKNVEKPSKKSTKNPVNYRPELKFSDSEQIEKSLLNKKITSIGRHGKYFWMKAENEKSNDGILILLHFGMTGWIKLKDVYSHFIQMEGGGYKKVFKLLEDEEKHEKQEEQQEEQKELPRDVADEWPPRFYKFLLTFENNNRTIDIGFVDPRRLARVRFFQLNKDLEGEKFMQNIEQLDKLGPDYSKTNVPIINFAEGDPDPMDHGKKVPSLDEFKELISKKSKLTVKPFLLKQEYFSGIGNWMADEVLFLSKIYPEDLLGVLTEEDVAALYHNVIHVSQISVNLEAHATKFPRNWLMLYRWGKKEKLTFEGHKVKFMTVGGRTSCYVAEIQKKRKRVHKQKESDDSEKKITVKAKKQKTKTRATRKVKEET